MIKIVILGDRSWNGHAFHASNNLFLLWIKRAMQMHLIVTRVQIVFFYVVITFLMLPQASAQLSLPVVYLNPLQSDTKSESEALTQKLDEEIRKSLKQSVRFDESESIILRANQQHYWMQQADQFKATGRQALLNGQGEEAIQSLNEALSLYTKHLILLQRTEAITETLISLGEACLQQRRIEDARAYFAKAAVLLPGESTLKLLSPGALALFQDERSQLQKKKQGILEITTEPVGARVTIDGREYQPTPVRITDLMAGEHYVRLSSDPMAEAIKIELQSGKKSKLKVDLNRSKRMIVVDVDHSASVQAALLAQQGFFDERFQKACAQVAQDSQAQYVVVGHVAFAEQRNDFVFRSYVYDARIRKTVALKERRLSNEFQAHKEAYALLGEVEQVIMQFPESRALSGQVTLPPIDTPLPNPEPADQSSALEEPEPIQIEEDEPQAKETRWYQSWWFVTATSLVVIGGVAVGGYFLLSQEEEKRASKLLVEW